MGLSVSVSVVGKRCDSLLSYRTLNLLYLLHTLILTFYSNFEKVLLLFSLFLLQKLYF